MKSPVSLKFICLITLMAFLSSCADKPKEEMKSLVNDCPGMWTGLWQGFILPFSLLGKIFSFNIGIHELNYSGATYWIGYLIGFLLFIKLIIFFVVDKYQS